MLDEIKSIIETRMGIKRYDINPNSRLGEQEIGLDSQEIIEFTCMVEKNLDVKLPGICFTKNSTIGDVINRVQNSQASKYLKPSFEGKIEANLEISCTPEEAYRAIYEMHKWPEKLPHVKRIEILYNDGVYQEFLMDVESSNSEMIQVRSIRRCVPDEGIVFFQPTPPKFLKHHCGGWSFQKLATGCCVKTWHQWNLEPQKAKELFPTKDNISTNDRISSLLLTHAELALSTWKERLEAI